MAEASDALAAAGNDPCTAERAGAGDGRRDADRRRAAGGLELILRFGRRNLFAGRDCSRLWGSVLYASCVHSADVPDLGRGAARGRRLDSRDQIRWLPDADHHRRRGRTSLFPAWHGLVRQVQADCRSSGLPPTKSAIIDGEMIAPDATARPTSRPSARRSRPGRASSPSSRSISCTSMARICGRCRVVAAARVAVEPCRAGRRGDPVQPARHRRRQGVLRGGGQDGPRGHGLEAAAKRLSIRRQHRLAEDEMLPGLRIRSRGGAARARQAARRLHGRRRAQLCRRRFHQRSQPRHARTALGARHQPRASPPRAL